MGPCSSQANAHVTSETNRIIEMIESVRSDISDRVNDAMREKIGNAVAALRPHPPPPMDNQSELYIMTNPC